jgi:tripartite ATP-independent transporter DctP family solute receptor
MVKRIREEQSCENAASLERKEEFNMITEWRKAVLCCFAGLVCILILTTNLFAAEYNIRIASDVAASHSWGRASELLKKYIEEVTKGRIKVEVYHAGTLGKTREAMEMVKMGTLEVALGGVSHIQRHVAELGILGLPYLWKDSETMFQTLDGALGKYMESRLDAVGFHTLGFWDNGFRHITNNRKPILSVADLKGLKIRTMPNPVHIAFFKALGAAPMPMDWTEVFEALRTGVIDAQENPIAQIHAAKLVEVQKYCSLTAHVNEPAAVVMSKIFYSKLPDDLKLAVNTAARKATLWQRVENGKDNQKFLNDLKEAGMKINTPYDASIAEFRKIGIQGYEDVVKGFGKMGKEITELLVWANK